MNRIRPILMLGILMSACVLIGCRPKGILRSRQMREVMVDLHKTDAMLQLSGVRVRESEAKNIYYAQVLESHGITQAQFDSSLVWYTAHPKLFDKIYPKVLAQLQTEEAAFLAANEEALQVRTSHKKGEVTPSVPIFTPAQLDSVLRVMQHGHPSSWHPLVQDFEDEFFPQIGVLSGGVVDSL